MAPILKITLVQIQPKPLAVEDNFRRAEEAIRQAAAAGSHLVVLPEYHLTSWVPEDPGFVSACARSSTYLARYQALARELNVHIIPGTIVRAGEKKKGGEGEGGKEDRDNRSHKPGTLRLLNVAHFVGAGSGEILGEYTKKNLWHAERGVLEPDLHSPHAPFDVPLVDDQGREATIRVGLLICWDLAFPEAFRELVAAGAQLVVIPSWWLVDGVGGDALRTLNGRSEVAFLDGVAVARAFENTCAVAVCNAFGQSQLAMPILGCVDKLGAGEEGTVQADVDVGVLAVAEGHYKVRRDLAGVGWHYPSPVARDG